MSPVFDEIRFVHADYSVACDNDALKCSNTMVYRILGLLKS